MKLIRPLHTTLFLSLIGTVIVSGCSEQLTRKDTGRPATLNQFLEKSYQETLQRSPMTMDTRADYSANNRWDDYSDTYKQESQRILKNQLSTLDLYPRESLTDDDQLSRDMFVYDTSMQIEKYQFRYHQYPVSQMFGIQTTALSHLMNVHKVSSKADAEAYIARMNGLPIFFNQVISQLSTSEAKGIIAPRFALKLSADQIKGLTYGTPLQQNAKKDNLIFSDFKKKVSALSIPPSEKAVLISRAQQAMLTSVGPALKQLHEFVTALADKAVNKGVWSLPSGDKYYQYLLKQYTTTELTAEQIHQLGWSEIKRIHGEIKSIMKQSGYEEDMNSFFTYTMEDPQFFYSQDQAGRDLALSQARDFVSEYKAKLNDWFLTTPKADIVVKPIEAYRSAASPVAFYEPGAPDGSRAGIYYLNVYNPKEVPIWQMAALSYHEAIPGHHMQISIAQEKESLPSFRKFLYYSAYGEGWGLYSESLVKEAGFYQNAYDDYGRLVWELLRACRLVADTGIHHKRWTREQAIDFLLENMPIDEDRAARSVQRYFVMPGQATAYKIGQLKILELRRNAKETLGENFDIREFHDVILTNGAVPLNILENLVQSWIDKKLKKISRKKMRARV